MFWMSVSLRRTLLLRLVRARLLTSTLTTCHRNLPVQQATHSYTKCVLASLLQQVLCELAQRCAPVRLYFVMREQGGPLMTQMMSMLRCHLMRHHLSEQMIAMV